MQRVEAADASPRIPGFERLYRNATDETDPQQQIAAGRLLLGELNCTACHAAETSLLESAWITPRQAPVLTDLGARVTPEYLRDYLTAPRRHKPGLAMPDLLGHLPAPVQEQTVEALVQFLASAGSMVQTSPASSAVAQGEKLFHQAGCVACHNPRTADAAPLDTSVPLGSPHKKYSISSLAAFLKAPQAVRPSGRMPSLNLNDEEARNLASYLMQGVDAHPNIRYRLYRGNWSELPDFTQLEPEAEGHASGFDLNVASDKNNFGLRFDGFLQIPQDGEYRFSLGSDDGSRLFLDKQEVIAVDGVHPYEQRSGRRTLNAGPHAIRVDYFQGGGEWVLTVELEGPGMEKQPLAGFVTLTPDAPPPSNRFEAAPDVVEQGRTLFASLGCANCHSLEREQPVASAWTARPLAELSPQGGCLLGAGRPEQRETDATPIPDYELDDQQTNAIASALRALPSHTAPADSDESRQRRIGHLMTTFNCYACHARGGIGGVESERNAYFQGQIPEMGDEGRIPPSLDGAGDKLTEDWLKQVLNHGANDRPYMLARMPRFGLEHVGALMKAFGQSDRRADTASVEFREPLHRVKAAGRLMVGDQALSCVKCHTFAGKGGTGIQSLDLTTMTRRLRRSWFERYMLDPQAYRPGTRMPLAWPNGRSVVPKILGGDTRQQVNAIWLYLEDGDDAQPPTGLGGERIELIPRDTPLIYRNFIEGLSPRGIAVGYPEKAHLAFDAEKMCVTLIWHNAFIDAGKHWIGRGPGTQWPLGDHVFNLGNDTPFAVRDSLSDPWPQAPPREQGYQFLGYRFDEQRRPVFRYRFHDLIIEDHPVPIPGERDAGFRRTIRLTGEAPAGELWFRAATAASTDPAPNETFVIDKGVRIRHPGAQSLLVREGTRTHLLVRVSLVNGAAELVQTLEW